MKAMKKVMACLFALCICTAAVPLSGVQDSKEINALAAEDISAQMEWDTFRIGGGGFVSGIVTGQKEMYLRTDVGGAYKYNYEKESWEQLFGFINEADRGLLSVKGIAIDPTDDDTVYFLCGCAYFSDAKTVIFKTTDGGKTFSRSDVTEHIQVHGNGDGRECIEPIAIDPDNPDTIYAGGDVTAGKSALIKSTDGGKTWTPVMGYDDLGLFTESLKYPMWTEHMVRGTENKEYNQQNGIGAIHIEDGKVYVGTSVTGQANIHVASVKDDKFTALSKDLPTANYPLSITSDGNGNLFFTYIAGLAFAGTSGGAYKYNIASGKAAKLSVSDNAVGMIEVDKNDTDKMVARTCGVWSDQWYEKEWTDTSIAWGDHFFRSTDGGDTWQDVTPGQQDGPWGEKWFVSEPMSTGGYDWVYGKACHWGSGILLDPRNSDRIVLTSGNGVFACDNIWDEVGVQFYFQPDGVEEVVSLDFVSVPGGANYSAIGDYDGFIHETVDGIPQQYEPNMGSTSAIAYCPSAPEVMARVSNDNAKGYYSTDAGKTWKEMKFPYSGGKISITETASGKYRIIESSGSGAAVSYTDDFGATWSESKGIDGSKTTYTLVDLNDPSVVYASGIKHNDYWASDTSKKEPTFEESHYSFYVSNDYGATFTETQLCRYDQCDHTGDLAYLSKGKVAMAAGWYGMYIISDGGKNAEKLDTVFYAKTVGYGAPEKTGGENTLYIYGKPAESDPEGIYRSTDSGKTWVCINTDHLYGGTGNGNYLVGDMNEFGTVYMSTVGCGIVYGRLAGSTPKPPTSTTTTTAKTTTTSKATTTTTTATTSATATSPDGDYLAGDANCDKVVDISDAVLIMQSLANPNKYGDKGDSENRITAQGKINADCEGGGNGVTNGDALAIQSYLLGLCELPVE